MTNKVAALLVSPDGTAQMTEVGSDWRSLSGVIGGYLEGLAPATDAFGAWHAYADEEGRPKGLPVNPAATALALAIGWPGADPLVGRVLFLGSGGVGEDAGAEEADVPLEVVEVAVKMWGGIEAAPDS